MSERKKNRPLGYEFQPLETYSEVQLVGKKERRMALDMISRFLRSAYRRVAVPQVQTLREAMNVVQASRPFKGQVNVSWDVTDGKTPKERKFKPGSLTLTRNLECPTCGRAFLVPPEPANFNLGGTPDPLLEIRTSDPMKGVR